MDDPRFIETKYREQDSQRAYRENQRFIHGTQEENGFVWVKLGWCLGRWMSRKEYDDYTSRKDKR